MWAFPPSASKDETLSDCDARSDSGSPDSKPKLVLVPGLDGTALLFFRQLPRLVERFDVMTFPLPDDSAADMGSLVAELRAFIDSHSAQRVLLCGESFGGALSMSFSLAHPERVLGLVILNSFPVIRTRLRLLVGPWMLRCLPWGAMPLMRRYTEHRLHSPHASEDDLHEFRERSKQIGRAGYIRRIEILRSYDIRDRLRGLEPPALFLASDQDRLVPSVAEARFMSSVAPRASMQILRGYGHVCLINRDLDLLEEITPWFDALSQNHS